VSQGGLIIFFTDKRADFPNSFIFAAIGFILIGALPLSVVDLLLED